MSANRKPRILKLIDVPGWAFDITARGLKPYLEDEFDITILPVIKKPILNEEDFDLVHVYCDRENYHRKYFHGKARVLKGVNGQVWEDEGMSVERLYELYLRDAHALLVVNEFMVESMKNLPIPLYLYHQAVDTGKFTLGAERSGPLVAGWAGKIDRPIKQFHLTQQACEGLCELQVADGSYSQDEMVQFYHGIDIILSSSRLEGCPRPVVEAMSCGKFPVTFNIGMVREAVTHLHGGYITQEKTAEALREGIVWCKDHLTHVRNVAQANRQRICASRDWSIAARRISTIYKEILA